MSLFCSALKHIYVVDMIDIDRDSLLEVFGHIKLHKKDSRI